MLSLNGTLWLSRLRRHLFLVTGIVLVVVLAAIIAVPLSLGQPIVLPMQASGTSSSAATASFAQKSAMPVHAAAPSAPAGVGNRTGAGSVDLLQGRQIVRRANVQISVQDVGRAYQNVLQLVQQSGGYPVQSNLTNYSDKSAANIEVRVPVADLSAFLDAVSRLGHVDSAGQSGSDVTQQVVDVKARLQVLQAEEAQLLTFLHQAKTVGDMLKVEEQLQSTRTQIEELQAQQKTLSTQVAMATVDVTLQAAAPSLSSPGGKTWFLGQIWRVFTIALSTLTYALGRLLLAVVWLLPFAAVVAAGFGGWRAYRRRRARRSRRETGAGTQS